MQKPNNCDEAVLVKQVRLLLKQAEQILHEMNSVVCSTDPNKWLTNAAKHNAQDHHVSPEAYNSIYIAAK